MTNYRSVLLLTFIVTFLGFSQVFGQDTIHFNVSEYDSPFPESTGWEKMKVKSDSFTNYSLTEDKQQGKVIQAVAKNAAGGLAYKVEIDPNEYPIIEWRWQVKGVLEKGNLQKKDGDDYPARLYITFDYDKSNLGFADRIKYAAIQTFTSYDIPLRALNYVWASQATKGTIAPNAYTDWVYMVAIESREDKSGQWVVETRNILEDYKEIFGEEPPAISGIAIMTDTDNTGESTTAYYGNIIFRKTKK